nr:DNA phosphorothioation-associated putative methyltransferase [Zoogloeaceae bacterium]
MGLPDAFPAIGKQVGSRIYVHRLAQAQLPASLADIAAVALAACPVAAAGVNVLKLDEAGRTVSALNYPDFFSVAFPELREAWHVDLTDGRVSYRNYADSLNPPILHRKELLLPADHPDRPRFAALTAQAESLGLFGESRLIGFRVAWEARIAGAGYRIDDHELLPLGNAVELKASGEADGRIERHRTALSRSALSAPMQTLVRHGLLVPERTCFDYGCGRGDDLSCLLDSGYTAGGWDPYYAPDGERMPADFVNLGFVINVIEDFDERVEALRAAFALAGTLLVVSVMLYGSTPPPGRPFRDGYRTQRNTFQKYFTQSELKDFVENVLDAEAIPVGPGIIYVFVDKAAEQRFLFGRQRGRPRVARSRLSSFVRVPRVGRAPRLQPSRLQRRIDDHADLVAALWRICLELGREPLPDDFPQSAEACAAFGSWRRALRVVFAINDRSVFAQAVAQRRDDLLVFLALHLFGKRKPYRQLDSGIQRDIRAHFGDYARAQGLAMRVLEAAASPASLDQASKDASEQGLGYYRPSDYLQLHESLVARLPAVLRIYVGCGAVLHGGLDGVDLVKIHLRSGKLSLFKFDDFHGKPLPLLTERIKLKLRSQDIDYFFYGVEPVLSPPLYNKSRYLNEECPGFAEQLTFDEALADLAMFDPESYGPSQLVLDRMLAERRLEVRDFALCPARSIPVLDQACGPHFVYRDFLECGETWQRTRVDNLPLVAESYNALHALATGLLAPIIDYFGMIRLTYGFASPALTRLISSRVAPAVDQHAAHELNRRGFPVCSRLGAAVDFIVDDEDMIEVARWIADELPFDRMYVYGPDRPLHLSHGPENSRQVTVMMQGAKGLYPRTMKVEAFRRFEWSVRNPA